MSADLPFWAQEPFELTITEEADGDIYEGPHLLRCAEPLCRKLHTVSMIRRVQGCVDCGYNQYVCCRKVTAEEVAWLRDIETALTPWEHRLFHSDTVDELTVRG